MQACTIWGYGNDDEEAYEDVMATKDEMLRLGELNDLDKTIVSNEKDTSLDILEPLVDQETLWSAAEDGDLEDVQRCIRCGVDLDAVDENDQYSAMLIAAEGGHIQIVAALHQAGALVDTRDAFGRTPLYAAAVAGHDRVVAYLAKYAQADIEAADNDGRTPLWASCATRQIESATVLADLNESLLSEADNSGMTPFDFASQNGHADVISFLKKRGVKRPKSRLWTDEVRRSFILQFDQVRNDLKHVATSPRISVTTSPAKNPGHRSSSSQATSSRPSSTQKSKPSPLDSTGDHAFHLVTPNQSESSTTNKHRKNKIDL